jgi:PhnB protein
MGPDGRCVRIALSINGRLVYLSDMFPEFGGPGAPTVLGGTTSAMHIETTDPDSLFNRAISAGATPVTPMRDMFWGERQGLLRDPFGHRWSISAGGDLERQASAAANAKTYF